MTELSIRNNSERLESFKYDLGADIPEIESTQVAMATKVGVKTIRVFYKKQAP